MWIVLHLNPEPWAIGQMSVGRANGRAYPKMSRNPQVAAYQDAVRSGVEDYLKLIHVPREQALIDGPVDLRFWFWRRMDVYRSSQARNVRKHEVDATNCQKSTEDALHGIFFRNDKNDKHVESTMVVQDHTVEPCILISVEPYVEDLSPIPPLVLEAMHAPLVPQVRAKALTDLPLDSEIF